MTASNSVFFQVTNPPARGAAGWEVRVVDFRDMTTVLTVIYEYSNLMVGNELFTVGAENTSGGGSITLDKDSPFWQSTLSNGDPASSIKEYEYLFQAFEDGELRGEWFGTKIEEGIVEEDDTKIVTISGSGTAEVLKRACVLPNGKPLPSELGDPTYTDKYNWKFPVTYSAMRMWLILLQASQKRGTIPFVTPMFTELTDPAGKPWNSIYATPETIAEPENGIKPEPGTNLYDLLVRHAGQDPEVWFTETLEWTMWPGFKLDVRRHIGSDRSGSVVFFEGGVDSLSRVRSRDDIANYVVTIDVNGDVSPAVDSTSITRWGQREQLQNQNSNITDAERRDAIAQVFLSQTKDEQSEWTIRVPYDEEGRRPFIDYNLGDWIGISRLGDDGISTREKYRVLAIVVNVADDVTVELTLQSKLKLRHLQLQQKLTSIIHKVNNITNIDNSVKNNPSTDTSAAPDPVLNKYVIPTYDPSTGKWSNINLNGARLGGTKVFIQDTDPGNEAQTGDFWIDSTYLDAPDPPVVATPEPAPKVVTVPSGYISVPGTNLKMV